MHWILTELSRNAFTSIASAGAIVISFAATFLHAVAGTIIGGGILAETLSIGDSVAEVGVLFPEAVVGRTSVTEDSLAKIRRKTIPRLMEWVTKVCRIE